MQSKFPERLAIALQFLKMLPFPAEFPLKREYLLMLVLLPKPMVIYLFVTFIKSFY